MSHLLTEEYWESLGHNSPFLCELFHNQSQQLTQLQLANNTLEDHALEAQGDVTNTAAKAMLSIAHVILTNIPAATGSRSLRNTQVAEPESFNGNRYKAKQFIHIAVLMQLDTFKDERIKILYTLSFISLSCVGG